MLGFVGMIVQSALLWWFTPDILSLLGAEGEAYHLATSYLRIMWWSAPIFVLGFIGMAALRAVGDARGSMNCTLVAALVNAILDPLFIFEKPLSALGIDWAFGLALGIDGAAWTSFLARFAMVMIAVYGMIYKHNLVAKIDIRRSVQKIGIISAIPCPPCSPTSRHQWVTVL